MLTQSVRKHLGHMLMVTMVIVGMCCVAPVLARAQNSSAGTVTGQVTDAQGKAIVGAVVTLTNQASNGVTPSVTNNVGRYSFTNLAPGEYTLAVKKAGFKSASIKNQTVIVGKPLTLNVPMQVGSATQTVEVTATGAELQTMNATVGNSISGSTIVQLPNINRDANSLTMLQPNTNPDGGVGGAASDQNSFTIDGGNNSDDMAGGDGAYVSPTGGATSGVIPTPAESVEQFTVSVSNQSADVNSAAGSSVSMVTKRGTDTVHGSVYDYYLGSYLAANDWSNNRENTPRSKSHRNRFGAALGGEVLPNWLGGKTYVFGNYEGLRYPQSPTFTADVPTATLEAGVVAATSGNEATEPICGSGADAANGCADPSRTVTYYNLNPNAVTVGNIAYQPAQCTNAAKAVVACDPRGLGMNPVVAQLWKQYMPKPNNALAGDTFNTQGYTSNVSAPESTNFMVTRIDHDFGAKNHFELTYHWYELARLSSAQHDFGGGVPGDTLGVPVYTTTRPEKPNMWTAQFTSNISSNVTNTFNYSELRNFWQWAGSYLAPTPLTGFGALGGTLEIGGETSGALQPYNVNTQNVRTRVWDGIGNTFKDDITVLHGNHLFQFGARYTHQIDYHQRNDNGGGIMANTVYQITNGDGINFDYLPADLASKGADKSTYEQYYAETLGMVSEPQTLYTRAGKDLALQPLGTPMSDDSSIPMYNFYFADAWHIKPSLTLSYGAGYTIEMPPVEAQGKQVELVDSGDQLVSTTDYLAQTEKMALAGQSYNPTLGFATVQNVGAGLKYPYHPFYGGLSPRISLAWNPNITSGPLGFLFGGNKSVLRGGWSRIYGRLNGVDLVLVPLLGTGLGQPVSCIGASSNGQCLGNAGVDPTDAFRIGPTADGDDGMTAPLGNPPTPTLPQPYFPGELQNGVPNASAGSGDYLDPNFRPDRSDEFDLTFQRQLTPSLTTMLGYTGRIIRDEFQEIDLASVPYMMTAGGEQFQTAFAQLFNQIAADPSGLSKVTSSPFFTAALGGNGSAFCAKAGNCAMAVAEMAGPNANDYIDPTRGNNVYGLWAKLQSQSSWTLGRTNLSAPTTCTQGTVGCPARGLISGGGQLSAIYGNGSFGWGNFNSLFWSVNFRNFHGITGGSNFTWSKSMGTGQVGQQTSEYSVTNPFDMHFMYGPQFDSAPLQYNAYFVWTPGEKAQNTFFQHLAHGWSFAPIITWRRQAASDANGYAMDSVANGSQCSSFGEMDCSTGSTIENAVMTTGYTGGTGMIRNSTYGTSNPAAGGTGLNRWSDPAAVLATFRPLVLGEDTDGNGSYFPGLSMTDVDFAVTKDLALSERFSTELNAQATNVFNHFSSLEHRNSLTHPTNFGEIWGNALGARAVEVGLLVRW